MTEREEGTIMEKMNTLEKAISRVADIAREIRSEVRSNYVTKADLNITVLEMGKQITDSLTGLRQSMQLLIDTHISESNEKQENMAIEIDRIKTTYRAILGFFVALSIVLGVVIALKDLIH